jgi:hypothetical protein
MSKPEADGGVAIESTPLLTDLDRLIIAVERGWHMAWDGDDFLLLLAVLRQARDTIAANASNERRQEPPERKP